MQIIRGRLSAKDVENPNTRYNSGCDCIQITPDGGTTWIDAPGLDPRHAPAFLKPALTTTDPRCDAAANMVKWLKDFIDEIITIGGTVFAALTIVNTLLEYLDLLFPAADFLTLISDVAETIAGIGSSALSAAFTSTEYDLLKCIFYCNAQANGSVTARQLSEIETAITAQLNTTAALVTNAILFIQGEIGLSNAGAIGTETGVCFDCNCVWCYQYLWQTGDADSWNLTGSFQGTLMSGHQIFVSPDWQLAGITTMGIPSRLYMYAQLDVDDLADFHVTGFQLEWTMDDAYGTNDQILRFFNAAGTLVYTLDITIPEHGGQSRTTTVRTGLDIMAAYCVIRLEANDYGVCYNLQLTGDDPNPFPGSNC